MDNREIVAERVSKQFGRFTAVNNVSLRVAPGEIFSFLGPNGAGKSTMVGMLTTLIRPSSGRIYVGGFDAQTQASAVRRIIGVALQELGLDPVGTARAPILAMLRQGARRAHESKRSAVCNSLTAASCDGLAHGGCC